MERLDRGNSSHLKKLANATRLGVIGLALLSETKSLGVPMPAIITSYAIDLALPAAVATVLPKLSRSFNKSLELSYLIGFATCTSTEIMQGLHLMRGTYDPYDILTFGIGATGGYILDRIINR